MAVNAARDAEIARLTREGMSVSRIAQRVGLTWQGAKYAIDRLAGAPRKRPDPNADLAGLIDDDDDRQFWAY